MGAATAWQASMRGRSVVCLEAGGPIHTNGSSHGASRIFRQAYWEGEKYLPLLRLADQGWKQLQQSSGEPLLFSTGGLFIGGKSQSVFKGSLQTARVENIPHEVFDHEELRVAFPQFWTDARAAGIYEPGAYAIAADASRLQMLNEAVRRGARICFGESVIKLQTSASRLRVMSNQGNEWEASAVVVCAGPWMPALMPELAPHLDAVRMPIYWFTPRQDQRSQFTADRFPVFLYEIGDGSVLYGIPAGVGGEPGVKIGFHNRQGLPAEPDSVAPEMDMQRIQEIAAAVSDVLPGLEPRPVASRWCFYTMSPDESFLIGRSRRHEKLFYISACSGHGFKFAPGIGAAVADLATGTTPSVSLEPFSGERF